MIMDLFSDIKNTLNQYKIPCNDDICYNLEHFINYMLEYNEKTNITAITEKNDIIYKHILDSVWISEKFKSNTNVIDIGCGGGFPSIPLKIMNKTLNFTAIDSNNKKITFVDNVKNALNIGNFNTIHTRIEDIAQKNEYRESFDYAISRAVAPLPTIIEYSAPLIKVGGYIVAFKGSNYASELEISENALKLLGCQVETIEKLYIKEIDAYRYVIFIKKLSKTDKKYPRAQNKPRLSPL